MACGNISLASGIHCCPNFFIYLLPHYHSYIEKNTHIHTHTHTHTHISDCVQIVYELPLLPNNTTVKHFYTNLERCEVLTGYLSLERLSDGDWANT